MTTKTIRAFAADYCDELVNSAWFVPYNEDDREGHAKGLLEELAHYLTVAYDALDHADIFAGPDHREPTLEEFLADLSKAPDKPKPSLAEIIAAIRLLTGRSGDLWRSGNDCDW